MVHYEYMMIFLAIFLIFYLFLCIKKLDWAVMLILAVLPAYMIRFNFFGMSFTLLEMMILMAFFVWLFLNFKQIYQRFKEAVKKKDNQLGRKYPFGYEIIILLLITLIALAIADFSANSIAVWKDYFLQPILLYILIINVLGKDFSLNKILWPLCIMSFYISIFSLYQDLSGNCTVNDFGQMQGTCLVSSFFQSPTAIGLQLGPIIILMAGWLGERIKNSQKIKLSGKLFIFQNCFIFLTIVLSFLAVYFTKSLIAVASIVISLILLGLFANKKIRLGTLIVSLVLSVLILLYVPSRINSAEINAWRQLAADIKDHQWNEAFRLFTDSQLINGLGKGRGYSENNPFYASQGNPWQKGNNALLPNKIIIFNDANNVNKWQSVEFDLSRRNTITYFWIIIGIVGIITILWMLGKFFYYSIKYAVQKYNRKDLHNFVALRLIGAMVIIAVHGLVNIPFFKNDIIFFFWLIIAMLGIINLNTGNAIAEKGLKLKS